MIPKVIHYCWFGNNKKSRLIRKCIKSWKKYCKDYTIIEWNETNFNIEINDYVSEAYREKKWAFVSDYARLWIIYNYGGIYLDTDVELKKNIDIFLKHSSYFGSEDGMHISTGLGFGAEAGNEIVLAMLNDYNNEKFILDSGGYDLTTCPVRNTKAVFDKYDFKMVDGKNIMYYKNNYIYPPDYFSPLNFNTKKMEMTNNTYSIHWFDASWFTKEQKRNKKKKQRKMRNDKIIHLPNRVLKIILGENKYNQLKKFIKKYL